MFLLAAALLLPVPETVLEKLPSVLVDVAPTADRGAWVLARDERYGDLELWRISGTGEAKHVALPEPDGRRLQAIATSPDGREVWVLTHRALLRLHHPAPPASIPDAPVPAAPPIAPAAPSWTATPIWLTGGDLKNPLVVPLAEGRAAWLAEAQGAEGGPRLVGEIIDLRAAGEPSGGTEAGASVATFSLGCSMRGSASADGTGGLVIGGVGRVTPSPAGWLGSYAACGEPTGSKLSWQKAPLEPPTRIVAARGPTLWHWQGAVLKAGDVDAFTLPLKADGSPLPLSGATAGAEGRVWVGVLGYTKKNGVTLLSLGSAGVESSFSLPFPRFWKDFLRREPLTLREGAGSLWVLQTYPGKASVLLRREGTWGKWRAFYGGQVRDRVKWLKAPEATTLPGQVTQTYNQSYSCLSPISGCFGGGPPPQ